MPTRFFATLKMLRNLSATPSWLLIQLKSHLDPWVAKAQLWAGIRQRFQRYDPVARLVIRR
jgi:hypothetical protein